MLLPKSDTERVVNILCRLDIYADHYLNLQTGITLRDFPTELRNKVRTRWYQQPEILESYLQSNPDGLNEADLALLGSWRGRQRQKLLVVKSLKSGAILADKEHYLVLGWYDPIEDLLNGEPLPALVETTLLPVGENITYDGILLRYGIHFGSGARKNINEAYSYARRHGQILTSFSPAPPVLKPAEPAVCEHRPAVQSILKTTEKLRGGGTRPLHSPALAALRWAAQLAASSLEDQPDPQEIRKQLGQIRKVVGQIDRALYEGNY